jgi:hypothetical protein
MFDITHPEQPTAKYAGKVTSLEKKEKKSSLGIR